MTVLTPAALLGVLLLPGLIALHLYRREARAVEVPSLLVWESVNGAVSRGGRRWRLEHLALLIFQVLAVGTLVLALAQPATVAHASGVRVYVLDDGALMTAADLVPSRFAVAKGLIARDIQRAPAGTRFTIITANAQPQVVAATSDRTLAVSRLDTLQPLLVTPNWSRALAIAAGLLPNRLAHLLIVHAAGEILPPINAKPGLVSDAVVGRNRDDQAVTALNARCPESAAGTTATCSAFASIYNASDRAVEDGVIIDGDGSVLGQQRVALPPQTTTDLSFAVSAAHQVVELYLTRRDLVTANNVAWAVIPAPRPMTVTVVGTGAATTAVARACAALPLVHVVSRTPQQFTRHTAVLSGPLILVGWLPPGAWPTTPSLVLIAPPHFPGSRVAPPLIHTTVSGEETASPVLSGVDLTSLDIPPGTARGVVLPAALQPVIWAADGSLLATGTLQGRRVTLLSFDPTTSNLSHLNAFPLLIRNILQWTMGWYPASTAPGDHALLDVPPGTMAIDVAQRTALRSQPMVTSVTPGDGQVSVDVASPGVYTITERGAWGVRRGVITANAGAPVGSVAPIALSVPAALTSVVGHAASSVTWWPWLGLIAALVITVEALANLQRTERRAEQ